MSQLKSRAKANKSSGQCFLIVTEGAKTEPNYFYSLRDRLRLATADVDIEHPEGTDPLTLVRHAIELRDARKHRAKRENFLLNYDEVWVVFDLEKPNDIRRELANRAIAYGAPRNIKFAVSDPCFEYWLLLHLHYTTAAFFECNDVIERLKAHWGTYEKGKNLPPDLLENSFIAVQHAERCRRDCENTGGGPTTAIDLILRSLNNATRSHLRIKLD